MRRLQRRNRAIKRRCEKAGIGNSLSKSKLAVVQKPWGTETILTKNKWYTIKLIDIYPGRRTSLQIHKHKTESIYVVYGGLILFGLIHSGGSLIHIPPGTVHRFSAEEDALGCKLLEISHGKDSDIRRLEDDFGRK